MLKFGFYSFYYGAMGSVERTGFNSGVSIFLIELAELLGYNTHHFIIEKVKRKTLLFTSNLIKNTIGFSLIFPFLEQSPFLSSLVLILAFYGGTFNFSAITML